MRKPLDELAKVKPIVKFIAPTSSAIAQGACKGVYLVPPPFETAAPAYACATASNDPSPDFGPYGPNELFCP